MLEWVFILGTGLLSAAGTSAVLNHGSRLGLLHLPNDRSSHIALTPHGGGLGLVVAFLFTLSVLFFLGRVTNTEWLILAGCGGLVASVGLLDDIYHLAARWRFLAYLLSISLATVLLGGLPPLNIGNQLVDFGLIGDVGAVVLLLWWLNLYNFMDGIDGLAAVEGLSISLGTVLMLWLGTGISPGMDGMSFLLLLLAAAVSGFLVWNIPPARIFMGDVGSTFLGFVLGMLALATIAQGLLSPWTWLILGGVFIVDATVTLLRRMLKRERLHEAHRSHAYQKTAGRLTSYFETTKGLLTEVARARAHGVVSLVVLMINALWLLPLAYASQYWQGWGVAFVLLAWAPLVALALYLGAGER